MSNEKSPDDSARPAVLSLNIREPAALHAAFIPQLRYGGIFIPTNRQYRLGEDVFMLITLPEDPAKLAVMGKVVWLTPEGAQGKKVQGIGVQFGSDEAGQSVKRKIEAILAEVGQSDKPTHTL
ncbi:MAG: PilZ domain-containing protein [Betaproteobacteria bacterium]|nr:PilZ domain-containing protein [Betaproteobacteria bacterium]